MFWVTYKTTLKNLTRSTTFWLCLGVLVIIVVQGALSGHFVGDDDPSFVLDYRTYVQCAMNSCAAGLLMYAMPLFSIISVVIVLLRDYGDKFFEIEKSAGIRSACYLWGRIAAFTSVSTVLLLAMHHLRLHLYVFTRGGVDGISFGEYFADSFIRILRIDLFVALPCILFYIGLTYFLGAIFKNGIPAAIVSMGYVVAFYAGSFVLRHVIAPKYFDYFSPVPNKLRAYFHYYDTEWFEDMIERTGTSVSDAFFCSMFLTGIALLCTIISQWKIARREL